jgi:flagellar protein FlgJ
MPDVIGKQPNRVANKTRNHTTTKTRKLRPRYFVTFQSGASLPVVQLSASKQREHRDPNGSGNPLLDTSGKYRNVRLSRNFTTGEFAQSGGRPSPISRIDPKYVRCLQDIRDSVSRGVKIDSGYRSNKYNTELYRRRGKKPTRSQHISGRAGDIKIRNMSGTEIAEAAIDACGPNIGIGVGSNYAHIDVRGYFAIWGYDVNRRQLAKVKGHRYASMAVNRRTRGSARRIKT